MRMEISRNPKGVAADSDGNIYVVDAIRIWSRYSAGKETAAFLRQQGHDFDNSGCHLVFLLMIKITYMSLTPTTEGCRSLNIWEGSNPLAPLTIRGDEMSLLFE